MATRKRKSTPRAATAAPTAEPEPSKTCGTCDLFDYQDRRRGLCRLPPPFQVVHPHDRCSEWRPRSAERPGAPVAA